MSSFLCRALPRRRKDLTFVPSTGNWFKPRRPSGATLHLQPYRDPEHPARESGEMADVEPGSKKRELPPWMTEKRPTPKWRPRKRRKAAAEAQTDAPSRLSDVQTVYFMNEAELVDVALGILVECRKQEKLLEHTSLLGIDKTQTTQPDPPWASESSSDGEEEVDDAPQTGPSSKQECSTSDHKKSSEDEEDEDALKFVREIFFN